MKTLRIILTTAGFVFIPFVLSEPASARSSFYIGFGTSAGHRHSSFYHCHYPHYGWHSGCYRSWSYYPAWHSCSSGTSIHIESFVPVYVTSPVVRTRRVVTGSRVIVEPKRCEYKPSYDSANAKLFAKVRNRKSELLKALKIGDKPARIKAITELAGYSFDDNVRKALEEIILADPDPELRKQVAESLAKVKNMNLIGTLEKVRVYDTDIQVREQADKAIKKIKAY